MFPTLTSGLTSGLLTLTLALGASGCAGNRAYLDWRPGLSEIDFDGLFEISLAELDGFAAEASANLSGGGERGRAELGEALAGSRSLDPRGYGVIELAADGQIVLQGDRGGHYTGTVDWFALTPDRQHLALLSGSKLAVVGGGASTGIDVGSLIGGAAASSGYALSLVVRDGELTVFALPQFGGVVAANEPGYLFAFRHQPGAREPWDVSVARVVVTLD